MKKRYLPARNGWHRGRLERGVGLAETLERGAAAGDSRPLRSNLVPYQGINVLMLWAEAVEKGFAAPIWMTFKQALELGGHVRKGEKGSLVVYASSFTRTEPNDATGEELERDIPFMKGYTVFNVEQVEGLPANFYAVVQPVLDPVQRIARVDEFFARTRADIRHGGNRAFYRISTDHIQMPPFEIVPGRGQPRGDRRARVVSLDSARKPPQSRFWSKAFWR